jgi:hypothetical protein
MPPNNSWRYARPVRLSLGVAPKCNIGRAAEDQEKEGGALGCAVSQTVIRAAR